MTVRDTVLIVDDSPQTLGFLTEALEQAGYSVLIATSGAAALGIAERITPDMILMDAVMPGMDGFETCRQLKANPAISQVPIVFMTGLTETEHIVHALEAGGVDYLTKPINIDELRARIKVHLTNARSVQSARVALDASGRHLFAVDRDGTILWSTPQAVRLMDSVSDNGNGQVLLQQKCAERLQARNRREIADDVPEVIAANGQISLQLTHLGSTGPNEFLFRLTAISETGEQDMLRRHFGLTARESDVLLWVARGKTNRDIGTILDLSARTVNKHLEQIYVKLGVENRAAAAVKATIVVYK
ncbi:response regulator transcription factor [Ochrobactrum sp. GPK 3]|jgi:DNA-binding response OmpR family regulator|uniref:response regulator n=1 Tax=Brucella sp. 22210 TaxID=3453892 RepID=UPI0031384E3C